MAFVNMFNERVELFNLKEENERLAELFSDEKLQEEALWEAYSVKEISKLLSVTEEEALKLMNCGIFKTYRVGNEYRASKKSVEENKKVIKAVLTYQDKKTMSVEEQFYNAKGLKNVEEGKTAPMPKFETSVELLDPMAEVQEAPVQEEEKPADNSVEENAALIARLLSNPETAALLKALAKTI